MKIKTRRYYLYFLARVGGFFIAILPVKMGLYLAEFAGKLAFRVVGKQRINTIENLRSSFPDKTEAEIRKIAEGVFINLAKSAVELVNTYKLNERNIDLWVRGGDFEKLDRAYDKGKGAIMLASHFGNWELIHICFLLKGYPGTAIARRIYFDKYDAFISRVRRSKGVGVVYRDESPKTLLRILKSNGLIGILADQDVDSVDGIFVDFFGMPAYTPKAPVVFSLASGAPLVPCFMIREGMSHRLVIEDPIYMEEKATREESIRFNTERWSRIVESYIRRYPEQWVWMHRRWKTRPGFV